MHRTVMCQTSEFCMDQHEQGGEYGIPLSYWCMASVCQYPEKRCLFVQNGGVRPV